MRGYGSAAVMALVGALAIGAAVMAADGAVGADSVNRKHQEHSGASDPYLWLEDVHGAKPLAWVKAQNVRSTAILQADPSYQMYYDAILRVMDASDRIPYGDLDHQYVFNFWQDAQHPKGVWRRTSIADYANAAPDWDILLDLDQLAADEHENWVWKGAECAPRCSVACCICRAAAAMRWWCASSIQPRRCS